MPNTYRLIAIPALVLTALLTIGCTGIEEAGEEARAEEQADEAEDVKLAECTTDPAGMIARLAITNSSSKRSNYSVDVAFESPDGATQYATGLAFVQAVEPGQTANGDAHSLTDAPGEFKCRITTMDRTEDAA